jgi:hypothetical protein
MSLNLTRWTFFLKSLHFAKISSETMEASRAKLGPFQNCFRHPHPSSKIGAATFEDIFFD